MTEEARKGRPRVEHDIHPGLAEGLEAAGVRVLAMGMTDLFTQILGISPTDMQDMLIVRSLSKIQTDSFEIIDFTHTLLQAVEVYEKDGKESDAIDSSTLRQFLGQLFTAHEILVRGIKADDADEMERRNEAIASIQAARKKFKV